MPLQINPYKEIKARTLSIRLKPSLHSISHLLKFQQCIPLMKLSASDANAKTAQLSQHKIFAQKLWNVKLLFFEPIKIGYNLLLGNSKWCIEQRVYMKSFGLYCNPNVLLSWASLGHVVNSFTHYWRSPVVKKIQSKVLLWF